MASRPGICLTLACLTLSGLVLAGCAAAPVRYAGTVTTQQGACGLGFDAGGKASATLMIHGDDVQFAPTDGVAVLAGHVNGAGHVTAASNLPGADHKPFPQVFEGDRTGDRVVGRFASPRCRAAVALQQR